MNSTTFRRLFFSFSLVVLPDCLTDLTPAPRCTVLYCTVAPSRPPAPCLLSRYVADYSNCCNFSLPLPRAAAREHHLRTAQLVRTAAVAQRATRVESSRSRVMIDNPYRSDAAAPKSSKHAECVPCARSSCLRQPR
jgi:hypothetical protein